MSYTFLKEISKRNFKNKIYITAFKYFVLFIISIAINAPHLLQPSPLLLLFSVSFHFAPSPLSRAIFDVFSSVCHQK